MKILITGAKGMLAQEIRVRFAKDLEGNANELILTDHLAGDGSEALDITDYEAVKEFVSSTKMLSHGKFKRMCREMIRDFDNLPIIDVGNWRIQ